ncbi:hypothetical protein [Limimaricola cinnabarinus]|jgi:hypothetical protein|uniref:hypothetical protein n=1 Tax=Limimaricola cinnabarinus TaxID=1125964 RepID=UPI0013A6344E|nr:hypothetical protein [Limimaricola cinnabarinus]
MDDKRITTPGATEAPASSARTHKAGDDGTLAGGTRRFSAKRELTAVQRLMPLAFQGNEAWGDEVSAHWRRVEGGGGRA